MQWISLTTVHYGLSLYKLVKGQFCCVQANGQVPSVEVSAVENVMLWTDPWLTAKVFSLGLYVIICLRQLVSGAPLLLALMRQLPDMKHVEFQPDASPPGWHI